MKWLNSKLEEEVEHLLQTARKKASEFKKRFKQQRQEDVSKHFMKSNVPWMLPVSED